MIPVSGIPISSASSRPPFSGVAVSKDAQPGEMISPVSAGGGFTRTGICTLVDMKSLEIEVDVNEAYINRVVPNQRVEATLDSYPDWRIPGSVITTVPTADRQKATVKVRVGFLERDERVLPDMGVKVAFMDETARTQDQSPPAGVLIPAAALDRRSGAPRVWVVEGDRVQSRAVQTGADVGSSVQILNGLTAGDTVVVSDPNALSDGMTVARNPT